MDDIAAWRASAMAAVDPCCSSGGEDRDGAAALTDHREGCRSSHCGGEGTGDVCACACGAEQQPCRCFVSNSRPRLKRKKPNPKPATHRIDSTIFSCNGRHSRRRRMPMWRIDC